jgi:hypothetical protein
VDKFAALPWIGQAGTLFNASEGELPAPSGVPAKISLHCYQGAPNVEHWARFSEFSVLQIAK